MANDTDDHLLRAAIGKQMEWFAQSDVGVYLRDCADAEIESGIAKLKSVDPTNADGVRSSQNQIWLGEHFKLWVVQAIEAGKTSEYILEERND